MSAHIAIRCEECGAIRLGGPFDLYEALREEIGKDGWESVARVDFCPFHAAIRKAREKAEEANAGA